MGVGQLNKDGSGAKLLKSAVVKTPLSVYEATAGRELYRPVQTSPISNFFLAGCFTKQKYLASMEGATFSGKLAAKALADAAAAGTVSHDLQVEDRINRSCTMFYVFVWSPFGDTRIFHSRRKTLRVSMARWKIRYLYRVQSSPPGSR